MTAPAASASPPTQPAPVATTLLPAITRVIFPPAFLALFAVLLTSFPARNLDLWGHLTAGRDLFTAGKFSPTWLYDALAYLVASVVGGGGLVGVKAIACGAVATLLFRLSAVNGWRVALAVTGLTVLAMGTRLLVQPETASVVCLAVAVWLLHRRPDARPTPWYWPGWPLVLLFVVWANLDGRAVLGLGVVALTRLGQLLDARGQEPFLGAIGRWVATVGILTAAVCLSPSHVTALKVPPELQAGWKAVFDPTADPLTVQSPFDPDFVGQFQYNSSALAYFPLLALGLLSFAVNRRGWKWGWFLPWVGAAVVSGLQARSIPLFAVVAGPVTAWNLQAALARRPSAPVRPRTRAVGLGVVGLIAVAFLVAAWPGWLQGPPYEPRRWAAECPPALERGAEFLAAAHASERWPTDTRTLHLTPDTLGAIRWHAPQDDAFHDPELVTTLLSPEREEDARRQLREGRVTRVVVYVGDPNPLARLALDRLFFAPDEWPVLSLAGGLVVFGWDDPAHDSHPFAGQEVDFERLGVTAEGGVPPPPPPRGWWEVFWTPAYTNRPPGRDEAAVLLRKAEALRVAPPVQNLTDWEAGHLVALVGAGGAWTGPADAGDLALRLNLFRPAPTLEGVRPPPQTELVFALHQRFAFDRGAIPVGLVYEAVRAARRGVAENPTDANTHLTLAQAYVTLGNGTREMVWGRRVTQLQRARQVQTIAALRKAVVLNPRLAVAHRELSYLYRSVGLLDLALEHLRAYKGLSPRWGGPPAAGEVAKGLDADLEQLSKQVDARTEEYVKDTINSSVSERALRAVQLELGGKALDLLLDSDVAAFGIDGTKLEVELLLRAGRPDEVIAWTTETEEVRGSLGEVEFHWLRAQAFLAVGDYDAADGELRLMASPDGQRTDPQQTTDGLGAVVGKGVLDAQPGGPPLPHLVWFALTQSDLFARIREESRTLGLEANMITLRGVMALEAGNRSRAVEAFREALTFTPSPWVTGGQLEFGGRSVAYDGLSLLGER